MCKKEDILAQKVLDGCNLGKANMRVRIEHGSPVAYRLGQRANGEYVLQGCFYWREEGKGGIEWKDLETIKLP